jgi:uncharacterized membrane protein YebE (DUF533 family)
MQGPMNAEKILSQLLSGGAASGFAGGLAGGLASGLLTSKAGRKLGGKALQLGGLAAVAGLAYNAWSRYRQESTGAPVERAPAQLPPPAFLPGPGHADERSDLALCLLFAMIAAARADGKLDGEERRAIFDGVARLDLPETERAQLYAALERPADLEWLVRQATTPERAAEIYAASLLAIEVDTPAERGYLSMLAARLGLPEDLVASLHGEAAAAKAPPRASRPETAAPGTAR